MFVVGILIFQKWIDVSVLDFKIEVCLKYFWLFVPKECCNYFLKNLHIFFKSSSHPALFFDALQIEKNDPKPTELKRREKKDKYL